MNVADRLLAAWAVARGRAVATQAPLVRIANISPIPRPAPPALAPTQLTAHFAIAEAGCRDGRPCPEPLLANARAHAEQLEVLRAELGRPIRVNSWWRSAEHNRRVGSNEASQHRLARATDLVVAGMTPTELATAIERLIAAGRMKQGGIGIYPGFTHYDSRGTRARWKG